MGKTWRWKRRQRRKRRGGEDVGWLQNRKG